MENNTKEIKIDIPEGYEIDKENSTFECIKFKKIEDKLPRSWKEYNDSVLDNPAFLATDSTWTITRACHTSYDAFNTAEEANAFYALGHLIQLRDAWIGDWKAEWNNGLQTKYCIYAFGEDIVTDISKYEPHILAFPSRELRNDFKDCFKDLIEQAKMFI